MSFLSSPTILWGSLTWTSFTEALLMCPYTRYVNCSSNTAHHTRLVTYLPEYLWNLGFPPPPPTGTGKARQADSAHRNELLVLSYYLVGQLDMDVVHRSFTNVSVHEICKLLQQYCSSHEACHLLA